MSWDEFRKTQRIRVTLEELGLPEFWIDCKKFGALTPSELRQVTTINEKSTMDEVKKMFKIVILDWNLTDPDDGKVLKPDIDGMEKVPMEVLNFAVRKVTETREELEVPEKSGISSGQ